MKKLFYIGIGAVLTILALGVVGFAFAQAQNPPTPQPEAEAGTTQVQPGWGMMGGLRRGGNMPGLAARAGMMNWRQGFRQGMMGGYAKGFAQGMFGPMHDYMIAALAGKLGLTVEELQAKIDAGETPLEIAKAQGLTDTQIQELMEQAHDEALKAAVTSGILTQEQADAMDQRMEEMWQNGVMGGRMQGGFQGKRMGMQGDGPLHEYKVSALAEALSLTAEQVQSRLEAGETMLQIAQAEGLTLAQFQEKMVAATKNAVNQALADGKLTQAQADWMLERAEQIGSAGFGGGMFGRGGCPGMGAQTTQP